MNNRLRNLNSKKVEKLLSRFGFRLARTAGSHVQWKHPLTGRRVTVFKEDDSFVRKTLRKIIEQSGHSENDWVKMLDEI